MSVKYEVINLRTKASHGVYDTLDEARGCVLYDRLSAWEIWETGTKSVNDVVAYRDPGLPAQKRRRKGGAR